MRWLWIVVLIIGITGGSLTAQQEEQPQEQASPPLQEKNYLKAQEKEQEQRYLAAARLYQKSAKIALEKQPANLSEVVERLYKAGSCYHKQGNLLQGKELLELSLTFAFKVPEQKQMTKLLQELSEIYVKQDKSIQAIQVWRFYSWVMAFEVAPTYSGLNQRWQWFWKSVTTLYQALEDDLHDFVIYEELMARFFYLTGNPNKDSYVPLYRQRFVSYVLARHLQAFSLPELQDIPLQKEQILQHPDIQAIIRALPPERHEAFKQILGQTLNPSERNQWQEIFDDPQFQPGLMQMAKFLQTRQLWENLHLRVPQMLAVEKKYGPLDWRLPEAHVFYWQEQAKRSWEKQQNNNSEHQKNWQKIKLQTWQKAVSTGNFISTRNIQVISSPNFALLPTLQEYLTTNELPPQAQPLLETIVWQCYMYQRDETDTFYQLLQQNFLPENEQDKSLTSYIQQKLSKRFANKPQQELENILATILINSYQLAVRHLQVATFVKEQISQKIQAQLRYFNKIYSFYQQQFPNSFQKKQALRQKVKDIIQAQLIAQHGKEQDIWSHLTTKFPELKQEKE